MLAPTIVLNVVVTPEVVWPQPEVALDLSGPLASEQRQALFAGFNDVFASRRAGARYIFTNLVLGNDPNTIVSWSEWKQGALTRNQASKVLDALSALRDAL